jgi:hypothetical protein
MRVARAPTLEHELFLLSARPNTHVAPSGKRAANLIHPGWTRPHEHGVDRRRRNRRKRPARIHGALYVPVVPALGRIGHCVARTP